jgi:hypothetical protein
MAPSRRLRPLLPGAGVLLCGLLAACGGAPVEVDPGGVDGLVVPTPSPDPADFVAGIDNPYLPLRPGSEWVYEVTGEEPGTITVTVTDETRVVAGVTATVVRDVVTDADGDVVEDTYDWFAQDRDGNVWYLGEDTTAYDRRGRPDTEGSWEAGVDGARAGLAMPATPRLGDGYRQEYDPGEAEDRATVLALDEVRQVGGVLYDDLVVTEDTTPLEPGLVERKYYAPGTGLVYEETTSGGEEQVELVSYTRG